MVRIEASKRTAAILEVAAAELGYDVAGLIISIS